MPVLVARLDTAAHAELRKVVVELSYKNGAKRITTLLPVIEVTLVSDDMFTQDMSVEILLEAQDSKGKRRRASLAPGGRESCDKNCDFDAEPTQTDCTANG